MPITRDVVAIDTEKLGTVYMPRLSAFMITAIKKKAEELYPLPDPKPYEQPIEDALVPGDALPAVQNPEYQKLIMAVMLQRNRYMQYAALNALVVEGCTHAEIIALYKDMLDAMRQYAEIPDGDEFAVTLHYCILTPAEYVDIINAATKDQPLREEEIRENLRIFRCDVQRDTPNGNRRKKSAPDIQQTEQVQAQQPA